MARLSASSIGTYDKCHKKYHYQYILKPPIKPKDWSFLELGKCIHRTLELFHHYMMKNVCDLSEYKSIMGACFKEAYSEYSHEILEKEFEMMRSILKDYLDEMLKNGIPHVMDIERSFEFTLGDCTIRGFIDRLDLIGPGKYHIVDYKTNKDPKYLTDFQLLLYALAVKELYPDAKEIFGSYILLKHNCKQKRFPTDTLYFTEKDLENVRKKVLDVGRNIDLGLDWSKNPTILCNWCDFQEICEGPKKVEESVEWI